MFRFRPATERRRFQLGQRRDPLVLSPEWQAWLAENLLAGVPRDELVRALVGHGVPLSEVERRLEAVLASPVLAGARRIARRSRQLLLAVRLHAETARRAARPAEIPRAASPSAGEFIERYYATNTPVVLTEAMRGWPALERWTPQAFRARFGGLEVQIADGRDADPDCDMNFQAHVRTVRLDEYVDRVLSAGETNDFYMIANNRNLQRPALRELWDDLLLPPYLDPDVAVGGSALWLGPAGTVTPLHHDTSSILFCQIHGRKRIRLASPLEPALLESARGVYSGVDAELADLGDVALRTVDLLPGEALFIPVGWWHHVRALDVSISLALNNFRVPNVYEWYKPGAP